MWQRFTERARRVILLGQEEAGKMNSGHVGTEHLLLGLVRENEGVAAQVLTENGRVAAASVRQEIEDEVDLTGTNQQAANPNSRPKPSACWNSPPMKRAGCGTTTSAPSICFWHFCAKKTASPPMFCAIWA